MNYIKHFNHWLDLASIDDRLSSYHISMYTALFHMWNKNHFPESLFIHRNEIMQISKVGSTRTYYKCMHQLHEYGYINYTPSKCPMRGSKVSIHPLADYSLDINFSSDEQDDENDDIIASSSPSSTYVPLKQNRPISGSRNAPSDNPKVTPLLINNTNVVNNKQGKRRARTGKDLNVYFLKNQEKDVEGSNTSSPEEKSPEGIQQSKPISCTPSGNQLVSKNRISRDFSVPNLAEIREYFQYQLSGKYLEGGLDEKTRLVEAEKFFNHYESNGWCLAGKVPMRNWKASCRSWAAKIPYFNRSNRDCVARERKNVHVERFDTYDEPL